MATISQQKPTFTANSPKVFSQNCRIYLDDTDAGGIVYHANHFKLFERCRRDWLRSLGMTSYFYQQQSGEKSTTNDVTDLQFVVSNAQIQYIKPILLDNLVEVTVETVTTKSASMILEQAIWLNTENDKILLSSAILTLACVATTKNENGETKVKPTRLPMDFINAMKI